MDDAGGMGIGHRLAGLEKGGEESREIVGRRGSGIEDLPQRLAAQQPHHHERPAVVGLAELMDRHDAGMVETAGDPRLAQESFQLRRPIPPDFQRLDRHGALELQIERLVHHPHPAAADLADEPITPAGPRHADRRHHSGIDVGWRFAGVHHRPALGDGKRPELDGVVDRPDGELGAEAIVEDRGSTAVVCADDSLQLQT